MNASPGGWAARLRPGAAGCTVPRADRAGICNTFRCIGVHMMMQAWSRDPSPAAIMAHDEGETRAIGLYDEADGGRPMIGGMPAG